MFRRKPHPDPGPPAEPLFPGQMRSSPVEIERDRYRAALIECARISGADMTDAPPTWPAVDVWAIREVTQLRADADEDAAFLQRHSND